MAAVEGIAAQDFADLQAIDLRQHQIEQNEVGAFVPGHAQRPGPVLGEERREARLAELETQHLQRVGLVIDDQDLLLHHFLAVCRMSIAS